MISSKADYRFVLQSAMRKITVNGNILPLRNQKRIFRGEDEAFLEEAITERQFPKQREDFIDNWDGTTDFCTIQQIRGNPLRESVIEFLIKDPRTSWLENNLTRFERGASATPSIPELMSRMSMGRFGNGFIMPWRRDFAMPPATIVRGGYEEENNDTYWAQWAIEEALWDEMKAAEDAAEDKEEDADDAARSAMESEYERLYALSNSIDSEYSSRRSRDTAQKNALTTALAAEKERLDAVRDAEIKSIEEDDEGNKSTRIQIAKDECQKAKSDAEYRCYKSIAEIDKATESWWNAAYGEYNKAWDECGANYSAATRNSWFVRCQEEYRAHKKYYESVVERCPYLVNYAGDYFSDEVDNSIMYLVLQSLIIDEFRNIKNHRVLVPYRWQTIERAFADADMMYIVGSWDVGMSRLPYYATFNERQTVAYQDMRVYTNCCAHHPTLGGLGSFYNGSNLLNYGSGEPEKYGYYFNYQIVSGGQRLFVRLGNRYTVGKIKSVKGIVKVSENDYKWEYEDPAQQTGSIHSEGHKGEWRVVNFTKEIGYVAQEDCEEIDAIMDANLEECTAIYRQYDEDVTELRNAEEADIAAIEARYNAQIASVEATRDAQVAARNERLMQDIRAASLEANARVDATDDEDEKKSIIRELDATISSLNSAANADNSATRSAARSQIQSLNSACSSEVSDREDEYHDAHYPLWTAMISDIGDKQAEGSDAVDAVKQSNTDAINAKKKEYSDAWDEIDDDFNDEYNTATSNYSDAMAAARQISDYNQRQAAIAAAEAAYTAAKDAAYAARYSARVALVQEFVQEEIWSVNTEGRELWKCEVPPIARQMSGGFDWRYESKCSTCLFLVVEYDFPTLTGANTCANGVISSKYWGGVKSNTEAFWDEFLADPQQQGGQ